MSYLRAIFPAGWRAVRSLLGRWIHSQLCHFLCKRRQMVHWCLWAICSLFAQLVLPLSVFVIPHWFSPPVCLERRMVSLLNLVCCFYFISPDRTFKCHFLTIVTFWAFKLKRLDQSSTRYEGCTARAVAAQSFHILSSTSFHLCWFNFDDFAVSVPSLSFVNASSLTACRLKRIDCNCFGWRFAQLL